MKYVIMCGGNNKGFDKPRWVENIKYKPSILENILLLLSINKVDEKDIYISTDSRNLNLIEYLNELHLKNKFRFKVLINFYNVYKENDIPELWCDGFPEFNEPVTYIFGDVFYSDEAIRTIIETKTDSIEFFASSPPFSKYYVKEWAEPFAFKVMDNNYFRECIEKVRDYYLLGEFRRSPIAWELWQVIKGGKLNVIDYYNYTAINDYTCDFDEPSDIEKIGEAYRSYIKDSNNE